MVKIYLFIKRLSKKKDEMDEKGKKYMLGSISINWNALSEKKQKIAYLSNLLLSNKLP